jgi:glycosyltransferase involved in cell wall biosynthesis
VRVAHLTSAHQTDDARIFWKECLSLVQAGYDVTLVAADQGPPRRVGPANAVEILPVTPRSSRFGRIVVTAWSVTVAAWRGNFDIYHFHDPELLPCGLMLRLAGKRVIYDAHEDLPRDILFKTWIPGTLRPAAARAAGALEWLTGRMMSGVVAATPVIARRFPGDRTALVQNFANLSEFAASDDSLPRRETAAYVGTITRERCAIEMVRALTHLNRYPALRLSLAGDMKPASFAAELAACPGWDRVEYHGRQDRAGVRRLLAQARVGLALFHPLQSYIESQPVKLFEYMAAGLPVIASDFPGFRAIIEENGCGLCVGSHDPSAIAEAIAWLLDHPEEAEAMGRRGQAVARQSYDWNQEKAALLRLYDRVAGRTASTHAGGGLMGSGAQK